MRLRMRRRRLSVVLRLVGRALGQISDGQAMAGGSLWMSSLLLGMVMRIVRRRRWRENM